MKLPSKLHYLVLSSALLANKYILFIFRLWSHGCWANCWFSNQLENIALTTYLSNRDHGSKCPNFRHSWSNYKSYRIDRWLSRYPEFSKVPWTCSMQDLIEVLSSWKRHDHIDVVSSKSIYICTLYHLHFPQFLKENNIILEQFFRPAGTKSTLL